MRAILAGLIVIAAVHTSQASSTIARHIAVASENTVQSPELLALKIVKAARKHKIDPLLFSSIIAVESMYRAQVQNSRTLDLGIAQISPRTAKLYGFDYYKLYNDYEYNMDSGAKILADFQAKYATKEPKTWFCRYNVGTGALVGNKLKNCKLYLNKIAIVMAK